MNGRRRNWSAWARAMGLGITGCLLASVVPLGCGGSDLPPPKAARTAPGGSKDPANWPKDDRSMCEWRSRKDVDVAETTGPGALKPNIRRVYKALGEGDARHKTLICREVDTNLDGIKDVVRTFNEKGEAQKEAVDSDYDGRLDVWSSFAEGRLAQEEVDSNGDGKPDVFKFYNQGQLQRIKRDRNFDGRPDVWEIYASGRLERMGVDESNDGHVDRWDRDEQLRLEQEATERAAREKMAAMQDGGAGESTDAAPAN